MEQRVSLITLGVTDMEASATFYDAMGWRRVETQDGVVAYDLLGSTLGLYPKSGLADELGLPEEAFAGRSAQTLSYNVREKPEVSAVLAAAKAAGGTILKEAQDVFWGGHHGYFADLDGHIWEVAFNPFSPLGPDGAFRWNGFG